MMRFATETDIRLRTDAQNRPLFINVDMNSDGERTLLGYAISTNSAVRRALRLTANAGDGFSDIHRRQYSQFK